VAEEKKNPGAKPRGTLESLGARKPADEVIVAKETVVQPVKKKVAKETVVQPGKKKDPKIGGVKVTPIASPAKKETDVKIRTEPIKLEIASNILPHPAKVMWGGEDAVFTKGRTFGVFDGVSGAEKLDGVPLYSRTLAIEMKKRVGNEGLNVQEMTKFLTESADVADAYATGASTAVVASIGENGFLQALNVGDSCCMVIRDGKVAAKTREISHYWECPYQLSSDSPDRPKDGTKLNVELTPGDVIIMGSDGVFDNMSDDLILDTVASTSMKAGQIAKKLSSVSRKQSLDKKAVTPYSTQAQKRGLPEFQNGIGGKVDDVGCVVIVCK
jgi:protein phosphatase PTC7